MQSCKHYIECFGKSLFNRKHFITNWTQEMWALILPLTLEKWFAVSGVHQLQLKRYVVRVPVTFGHWELVIWILISHREEADLIFCLREISFDLATLIQNKRKKCNHCSPSQKKAMWLCLDPGSLIWHIGCVNVMWFIVLHNIWEQIFGISSKESNFQKPFRRWLEHQ